MAKNGNLHTAKSAKNDEFYTQLTDIEKEVKNYKEQFKNKVVFCNCDDPQKSNFWFFFQSKFVEYGLKRLISTHYDPVNKSSYKLEIIGDLNGDGKIDENDIVKTPLQGIGDFRDQECVDLLDQSDIVCTNPPFSLFREFIALLIEHKKKFLVIGNQNAITYKEIFYLIKDNKIWLGLTMNGSNRWFEVPQSYQAKANAAGYKEENGKKFLFVNGVTWFTNLETKRRKTPIPDSELSEYEASKYPKYDNYDAIEVSKVINIPKDYKGVMGVPITFLYKYCPEQFEIVDARTVALNEKQKNKTTNLIKDADSAINGKPTYARIAIRFKKKEK